MVGVPPEGLKSQSVGRGSVAGILIHAFFTKNPNVPCKPPQTILDGAAKGYPGELGTPQNSIGYPLAEFLLNSRMRSQGIHLSLSDTAQLMIWANDIGGPCSPTPCHRGSKDPGPLHPGFLIKQTVEQIVIFLCSSAAFAVWQEQLIN